jgi:hypothetical protein
MKTIRNHPIASAVLFGLVASTVFEAVPDHGISLLVAMALLTITSLIGGLSLPLFVRCFFTVLIFYFASTICLVGRTMEPGLTAYTIGMALTCFGMLALWPAISLLRLWQGRLRLLFALLVFPAGLFFACIVAGAEEQIFIRIHQDGGVGPTARWTVSNHWLSYDAETKSLDGSD